jgi:hypothetical protein
MLALMFYLGKVMYGGSYGKDVDTFSSPQQALGVFKAMFDKRITLSKYFLFFPCCIS